MTRRWGMLYGSAQMSPLDTNATRRGRIAQAVGPAHPATVAGGPADTFPRMPLRPPRSLATEDHLARSAYSLILNVLLTSGLGVGFWVLAARLFPAATVGRDAALISSMVFVSTVCGLNLGSTMLRFLPITKLAPARVVGFSYLMVAVVSVLVGGLCVVIVPHVAHSYRFVNHEVGLAVLWVTSVLAWAIFDLEDAVLTALRRAPWVPVENGTFAILKVAALPLLLVVGLDHAVFVAWVIPVVVLLVPVNYVIFAWFIPAFDPDPGVASPVEQFGWTGLTRFLANDYGAMLLMQLASAVLPPLAVAIVGGREGAFFYMPFMIVGAVDTLFFQVLSSLTVEGAQAPSEVPSLIRRVLRQFGPLLLLGSVVLVLGAGEILSIFGQAYSSQGASVLRLLALASVFRAGIDLYCASARLRGTTGRSLGTQALLAMSVTGLSIPLGRSMGVVGIGLAWLLGHAITSAAITPSAVRDLRIHRAAPGRSG